MIQNLRELILTCIFLRVSQLFIDYNYEHPDQYWQGSQIAYRIRYGYGYLNWQWTMQEPIRSPLYQLYLYMGYVLCDIVGCNNYLKQIAPKFMQMCLSVACDICLIKTANRYVSQIPSWIYLLLLTQWFYFSSLNRTYINSAETCLVMISFYLWFTREEGKYRDLVNRILVTITFAMRPTSLVIWGIIWPYELFTKKSGKVAFFIKNVVHLILIALFSIMAGTLWYGKLVWTEFNFFKYNLFLKFSELFGTFPFYFYFFPILPMIMGGYLVPLGISIKQNWFFINQNKRQLKSKSEDQDCEKDKIKAAQLGQAKRFWQLFFIVMAVLFVNSFSSHKQPRFLCVLTPFLLILSIKGFKKLQNHKFILIIIIVVNIIMFSGFNLTMKSGGTQILRDLRQEIDKYPSQLHKNLNLMYLCSPHDLPLMTVIQRPVKFRLLDTSPFRKLENFDEQIELRESPLNLFNKLSQGSDPEFVIIQQRYAMKGVHLNQNYQFLLEKDYTMISTKRNILIFDFIFRNKWDCFVLLKKK